MEVTGLGLPPFKVRGSKEVNKILGNAALPHDFRPQQLISFLDHSIHDDLDMYGCNYVNTVDGYTFPNEETYSSVEWLKDDLRDPISICFNLTESERVNMTFMNLYGHCDTIQSRLFEGLDTCDWFTETMMTRCNQTVEATLVLPLSNPVLSRDMYISKQLRLPL